MLGWVGSSQHRGIVDFVRSEMMNSPDDWDTICIPINLPTNVKAVDFPLDVSPTALAAGQHSTRNNNHEFHQHHLTYNNLRNKLLLES